MQHPRPAPSREELETLFCQQLEKREIYAADLLTWLSAFDVWRNTPHLDKAEPPASPLSRACAIIGGMGMGVHHRTVIGACNAVAILGSAIDADEQNPERLRVPELAKLRHALIRHQQGLVKEWEEAVASRDPRWPEESSPARRLELPRSGGQV